MEYKTDVNLCLNQIQKQYTNKNTNTFFVVRLFSKNLSYVLHMFMLNVGSIVAAGGDGVKTKAEI